MTVEPNTTERATTGDASAMMDETATQASAPRNFRLGYRAELDGVRGVAILCVFTYHFFSRRLPGGYIGVDIFFVLSGFLITYLLTEEWRRTGAINLKNFYARRALRLLPALFAWTFVLGVAALFIGGETRRLIFYGIAGSLSYVTNWLVAYQLLSGNPLSITWSLAIEEQFYLLYPLALGWALRRKVKPSTLVVALCAVVVAVEVRRALLWRAGAPIFRIYYATDTRADALMLGCLLGVLISFELLPRAAWAKWAARASALVSLLLLTYVAREVVWTNPKLYAGAFTVIALAATTALGTLIVYPPRVVVTLMRFAPLVWLGRISYALYLWHFPLLFILPGASRETTTGRLTTAALAILAATLSYYFIEQPFLRLKKKY
jgi:peptidoglycan/LPS O-acetylase OafA/YrhL